LTFYRLRPRSQLRDGGLQNIDGLLGRSLRTYFARNELSEQILKLAWQRLSNGGKILCAQLSTNCGQ